MTDFNDRNYIQNDNFVVFNADRSIESKLKLQKKLQVFANSAKSLEKPISSTDEKTSYMLHLHNVHGINNTPAPAALNH